MDQVLDSIAAKYGGALVAPPAAPAPAVDPIAAKYGGAIAAPTSTVPTTTLSVGGKPYATGEFTLHELEVLGASPAAQASLTPEYRLPPPPAPESLVPQTEVRRRQGRFTGLPGPENPLTAEELPSPLVEGAMQVGKGTAALGRQLAHPPVLPTEPRVMPASRPGEDAAALNAASDLLEGAMKLGTPLVVAAAIADLPATALTLGAAHLASVAAGKGADLSGASPEMKRFVQNLAAAGTATLGGREMLDAASEGTSSTVRALTLAAKLSGRAVGEARPVGRGATVAEAAAVTRPGAHAPIEAIDSGIPSTVELPPGSGPPETLVDIIKTALAPEPPPLNVGEGAPRSAPRVAPAAETPAPIDPVAAEHGGVPVDEAGRTLGGYAGPERRATNAGPPAGLEERRLTPREQVLKDVRDNPEIVKQAAEMKAKAEAARPPAPIEAPPLETPTAPPVDATAAKYGGEPIELEAGDELPPDIKDWPDDAVRGELLHAQGQLDFVTKQKHTSPEVLQQAKDNVAHWQAELDRRGVELEPAVTEEPAATAAPPRNLPALSIEAVLAAQTEGTQQEQDAARDDVQRRIDAYKAALANTRSRRNPNRKTWEANLKTLEEGLLPRGHQKVTAEPDTSPAVAAALPRILETYRALPLETLKSDLEQLEENLNEWPSNFPMEAVTDYEDAGGPSTAEGWQALTERAASALHRLVLEREGQRELQLDDIAVKYGGEPVEAPTTKRPSTSEPVTFEVRTITGEKRPDVTLPAATTPSTKRAEKPTVEGESHAGEPPVLHGGATAGAGERGQPAGGPGAERPADVAPEQPAPEAGVPPKPEAPARPRNRRPRGRVAGAGGGTAAPVAGTDPGASAGVHAASHVDTADLADEDAVGDANARGEAPRFFTIDRTDALTEGGWVSKLDDNLAALRLLKDLERAGRPASDAEQAILARYVGWGHTNLAPVVDLRGAEYIRDPRAKQAREELDRILTTAELKELFESSPNAHYSFVELPRAMWAIVQRLGFKGGTILEPAVGTGHFLGTMPPAIRTHRRTKVHAVDKEPIAAGIARQLYQGAFVQAAPLQDATLPDNYFDLAISNVPFGDIEIFDPAFVSSDRAFMTKSVHNYYFAKALDVVRPGGLVVFVTSRYTMDARSDAVRRYIGARAKLLGAFRLPDQAFRKTAGTDVVTDVIVLQKHGPGVSGAGPAWAESTKRQDLGQEWDERRGVEDWVHTNEYYVKHPEMILGQEARSGKMHGRGHQYNVEGALTPEILGQVVGRFAEHAYKPSKAPPRKLATKAPADAKQGMFVLEGGKLYTYDKGTLTPSDLKGKAIERAKKFIPLRDAYQQVLDVMTSQGTDADLQTAQRALKSTYDAFVKAFGHVNIPENRRVIEADPNGSRITALENVEVLKGAKGTRTQFVVTGLAPIFTTRTIKPITEPTRAESTPDALVYSLAWRGMVDLPYMQGLTGKTPDAIAAELVNDIYQDPATGQWLADDEYLSGDVVTKLAVAEAAAQTGAAFRKNVDALRKVQPPLKTADDFSSPFGATWVPVATYERFLQSVIGRSITVRLLNTENRTEFYVEGFGKHEFLPPGADVAKWAAAALNGELPLIRVRDTKGNDVVDPAATEQYRQSLAQLREQWASWWKGEKDAAAELTKIYNAMFNRDVPREFDGKYLVTPNANPAIALRPWQKRAVIRALRSGNTLLAHAVGAGKTYAMIAIAGEWKRLGLATKPMIVVPNHLLEQWRGDFLNFYPGARVLMPDDSDFAKEKRKRLVARIANNDWDAIVMAQSQFLRVSVKVETLKAFIEEQEKQLLAEGAEQLGVSVEEFDELVQGYDAGDKKAKAAIGGRGTPRSVKDIARAIIRLRARLQKRLDQQKKDSAIAFEELGVDGLLIDEAHLFKNLYFATAKNGIVGLKGSDADRALDMFLKVRLINQTSNQRNVVFATGTPVSNTMSEIYTMFRYLAQPTLDRLGMAGFDSWANSFAVAAGAMEPAPGGGYKERTRLRDWNNLRELAGLFRRFADVVSTDDLVKSGVITLPTLKGGRPTVVALEPHPEMPAFMADLQTRIEALRTGKVDPKVDNHLKITTQAALAAVDLRLVVPTASDDPGGRLRTAAKEIAARYKTHQATLGTQVVFLDVGTPKKLEPLPASISAGLEAAPVLEEAEAPGEEDTAGDLVDEEAEAEEAFAEIRKLGADRDLYSELKRLLVAQGIKPDEVAFIHQATNPAEQKRLFAAVNAGRVRVLLATTSKGGVGMNIQKRLVALHHLDVPWRPADMEQREGRILRQGNENPEVEILRYVTKKSFDEYRWGLLATKQGFISQFLKGEIASMEDFDPSQLDMQVAAALASGDPRVLQMLNKEREIVGLRARYTNFKRRRDQAEREVEWAKSSITRATERKKAYDAALADARTWEEHPTVVVKKKPGRHYGYDTTPPNTFDLKDTDARKSLKATLAALLDVMHVNDEPIATAGPFLIVRNTVERSVDKVVAGQLVTRTEYAATLSVKAGGAIMGTTPEWDHENPPDVVRSLDTMLKASKLAKLVDEEQRLISERRQEIAANEKTLEKTFDQEDLLKQKEKELYDLRVALGVEKAVAAAKTAEEYADELRKDADEYHNGTIDTDTHHARNRATWDAIDKAGLKAKVLALLRQHPPSETVSGGEQAMEIEEPSGAPGATAAAAVPLRAAFREASEARSGIVAVFAPAMASGAAETMAAIMRPNLALRRQRTARAQKALRKLEVEWDRQPRAAQLAFAMAVDEGRVDDLPEWQRAIAQMFHDINTRKRREANAIGGNVGFIEHYYPREWVRPGKVREFIMRSLYGKRPLQGRAGFKKARSRDKETGEMFSFRHLYEAGFEPVSFNPVTAHLRKWLEMDKWIAARRILLEGKRFGVAEFVPVGEKSTHDGSVRYPESFGTVYGAPVVPVKEAFDAGLMEALHRFAVQHGITVVRRINLGGKRWGYHVRKGARSEIHTRFAGPEGILMHEVGHALDASHGLGEKIGLAQASERHEEVNFSETPSKVLKELRALADLRTDTRSGPSFRRYVRQRDEIIANLVHAFLYAPDLAKEVAPNAYWALYNLAKDTPDLRGLLDIQKARSLRFGVNVAEARIQGRVIRGYYYGPPDAVRLLENHLSPGLRDHKLFNLYRRAGNLLNQVQLGLSAFHLVMTSVDQVIGKTGMVAEHLTRGQFKEAAKKALMAPVAPLVDVVRGDRLLKQFYARDASFQSVTDVADAVARGGGGVGWDTFWHESAPERFMQALRSAVAEAKAGHVPRATLQAAKLPWRGLLAAVELQAKPIMEWWVPRLKLAAYWDLYRMELQDLGPVPDEIELRKVAGRAWDTVDNWLGELVYDNLFWHAILKDAGMASVRALGWNLGTVRGVFGAVPRQLRQFGLMPGAGVGGGGFGKPPSRLRNVGMAEQPEGPPIPLYAAGRAPWLTHDFARLLAALFWVALYGAIYQKLHTGLRPGEDEKDGHIDPSMIILDLYFPRTGGHKSDGRPERASIPSYVKEIFATLKHPVETAAHKLHPLLTLTYDVVAKNEDYFGTEIRNTDDPWMRQARDIFSYVADQYKPISVQSFQRRRTERGETGVSAVESFFGINPAPQTVTRTEAEEYLHSIQPPTHRTKDEAARAQARRDLRTARETGNAEAARTAIEEGHLTRRSVILSARAMRYSSLQRAFQTTTLPQALKTYEIATPDERVQLKPLLARKWHSLIPNVRPDDRPAMLERFNAAMKLPMARAPAAAAR